MSDEERKQDGAGRGGEDEDFELEPVERRAAPRAPVRGVTALVLEGEPLKGRLLAVGELGTDSFFVVGHDSEACEVGSTYHVRIHHEERHVQCRAECVRKEDLPRMGAVLKLLPEEKTARQFLEEVLGPSGVPLDAD